MKNIMALIIVSTSFIASACALENDTPTPTTVEVAPPSGEEIPSSSPTEPMKPKKDTTIGSDFGFRKHLKIVADKNMGSINGYVGLAESASGFVIAKQEAEGLPVSVSVLQLNGDPWRPTAFLPNSDFGYFSVAVMADGEYAIGTGAVLDKTIHTYVNRVSGTGEFRTSDHADDFFPVRLKTIGTKTYIASVVGDWDGLSGTISVASLEKEGMVKVGSYAFKRPNTDTSARVEDFGLVDGTFTFAIDWSPHDAKPSVSSLLVQEGETLREVELSAAMPATRDYRCRTQKLVTMGGKHYDFWRIDEMPLVETFVAEVADGKVGYTTRVLGLTDLAVLGDLIAATTYEFASGKIALKILRSDMTEIDSIDLGLIKYDWRLRLATGTDGRTIGVTWQDAATDVFHFTVVEYR